MPFHAWESPRDGRRVLLSESAVRDLRMLAIERFTALRRRGLEVGGILFGEFLDGETRIEIFQEVPCEHRYGPSYTLSQSDLTKLGETIAQPPNGTALRVAGFFRSFTSPDPVIGEADETLM